MAKRGKSRKKKSVSHQKNWIWGRHAVMEVLEAGRWPIAELHLRDDLDADLRDRAEELAKAMNAKISHDSSDRLFELCHTRNNQGLVAKMDDFPYLDSAEEIAKLQMGAAPFWAILDGIQDAFNFGAIIRSAEVLGVDALCVGTERQAVVNSQVARSSVGAVNRVPIMQAESLKDLALQVQSAGFQIIAANEKASARISDCDLVRPTALILGNEGQGITPELLDCCDARFRIPQSGEIGSLNVAAAAAIIFYECQRQRSLAR
ncbi:MAG: TrmH family RNA methyltransferase [Candidatus Sumerlaeota bacterium]